MVSSNIAPIMIVVCMIPISLSLDHMVILYEGGREGGREGGGNIYNVENQVQIPTAIWGPQS